MHLGQLFTGNCASPQDGGSTTFTPIDTGHVLQQEWPFWELVSPSNLPEKADDREGRAYKIR